MVDHPGITIDTSKVKRVNSDATFTQGFLCLPASDHQEPSSVQIDAAISGIRMPDHPDQRYHAVQVSKGTAIYIYPVSSPSHAVEVARMIADAIAVIGFTGTVTACADGLGPRPRTGRSAYMAAICAADAAMENRETPLHLRKLKKNLDRWAVTGQAFRDIVDLFVRWAEDNTTGPILAGLHFTMSSCEPHQAADVITRCCEDIGWAELLFPTSDGDWYVGFSGEGWIVTGTEIKASEAHAIESLIKLLEEASPLYDYAAITRGPFGLPTPRSVMIQPGIPGPGDIELSSSHGAMRTSIPGVFGAQVLSPGHADLKPPGFWTVTPFRAGRRIFSAPRPDDWWAAKTLFPAEGFEKLREANRDMLNSWI